LNGGRSGWGEARRCLLPLSRQPVNERTEEG
jgi:hypothetical protein